MRDATQEESEGVNQYIESISKETDVNFNDFLSEQFHNSIVDGRWMKKIEECDVVKRNRFNAAPEIHNGKCFGYGHYGDEPIEECQNCPLYESYGIE